MSAKSLVLLKQMNQEKEIHAEDYYRGLYYIQLESVLKRCWMLSIQ